MNTDNFDTIATANQLKRRPLRHLNELREGINVSFEYFPPKTESATQQIQRSSKTLERFCPTFSSVTYGAGGSIETHSFEALRLLRGSCSGMFTTNSIETHSFEALRLLRQSSAYPIAAHITQIPR